MTKNWPLNAQNSVRFFIKNAPEAAPVIFVQHLLENEPLRR